MPEVYERCLVPLIFELYADDLFRRTARLAPRSVLEIAAGTGVVTRRLASGLDASVEITASDLNPDMIEHAATVGTSRPVTWRQADVMRLPFPESSFDVVVCQFSAMFFTDRPTAYSDCSPVPVYSDEKPATRRSTAQFDVYVKPCGGLAAVEPIPHSRLLL